MIATPFPMQASGKTFGEDVFYRLLDEVLGAGVVAATDLQVIQNPAGADLSVSVAAGEGYVSIANGGKRQVYNDSNSNSGRVTPNATDWLSTFATADATNPRIDRVVVTVRDSSKDGSGAYDAKFQVVKGTATAGATLVNLTGAAAVPANSLLLANVLVPAGATTVVTANIDTTVRVRAIVGAGTAIGTAIDVTATTVAGLGTAVDGKSGRLRIGGGGTAPFYDVVGVVYNATYGKWVSPVVETLFLGTSSASGTGAVDMLLGSLNGHVSKYAAFAAKWADYTAAGLTPQIRFVFGATDETGGSSVTFVGRTASAADGAAMGAQTTQFTSSAVVLTTAAAIYSTRSGWQSIATTPSADILYAVAQINKSTANANFVNGQAFAELRWIA